MDRAHHAAADLNRAKEIAKQGIFSSKPICFSAVEHAARADTMDPGLGRPARETSQGLGVRAVTARLAGTRREGGTEIPLSQCRPWLSLQCTVASWVGGGASATVIKRRPLLSRIDRPSSLLISHSNLSLLPTCSAKLPVALYCPLSPSLRRSYPHPHHPPSTTINMKLSIIFVALALFVATAAATNGNTVEEDCEPGTTGETPKPKPSTNPPKKTPPKTTTPPKDPKDTTPPTETTPPAGPSGEDPSDLCYTSVISEVLG